KAVKRDIASVLAAGKVFSAGAKQPVCARAALQALVRADTSVVERAYRWVSLLTLNGVDEALAYSPNAAEIGARATADLALWPLLALYDGRTPDLDRMRRRALDSLAANYATRPTEHLWYLSVIALRVRDTAALASIQRIVELRADSSGARMVRLVAAEASARLSLLRGDSAGAIKKLEALKPTARRNDITWQPWESLGAERMMLA